MPIENLILRLFLYTIAKKVIILDSQTPRLAVLGGSKHPNFNDDVAVNDVEKRETWRKSLTTELRSQLADQLVQAIFPTSGTAMLDSRMNNLRMYARHVENDMFEAASSCSEYYHLVAEKIRRILEDLEEKRQRRREAVTRAIDGDALASRIFSRSE